MTINELIQYSGSFALEAFKYFKKVRISRKKFKIMIYQKLDFIKDSLNKPKK